ncbi:MAG: hypothetical protein LBE16_04545 [Clostridiales Family XIII bacterium]|jgi:uncharacterized protein YwgA|nr:hypothetical protein [Clostridiales Family XIII bacterium]
MRNKLQNNVAYIIQKIGEIYEGDPGKKALQKLVFLVQKKGLDLGYGYGLHFYGPYSNALDAEAISLCMDGVIDIDTSSHTHKLRVNSRYAVVSALKPEEERTLAAVLRRYKGYKPTQLELLTTAIYAYEHLPEKSRADVMAGVKKIKGEKFSDAEIEGAMREFSYFGIDISA